MLSERAHFNVQTAEDTGQGSSRKFLLDVESMMINSEGEVVDKSSLMRTVGRKMRNIIESQNQMDSTLQKMKSGGNFSSDLNHKDSM